MSIPEPPEKEKFSENKPNVVLTTIKYFIQVVALLVIVGVGVHYVLVRESERQEMLNTLLPSTEKHNIQIICLNGVEYWYKSSVGSVTSGYSLAPKFSPGNSVPDECQE